MNKVILTIIFSFIFSSTPVLAGRYHHPHRDFISSWRGGHSPRLHRHRHHGHHAAAAIGGLVVGGIIGSAIANTQNRTVRYIDNPPIYRNNNYNPYANGYRPQGGSGYFRRESNGECFLVNQNDYGNEVFTSVPARNCQ